jgi:hypothetical protein
MTWADEIDVALERAGSPHSAADLLRWLREGDAYFVATEAMRGSVWFNPAGEVEIGHLFGRWDLKSAVWMARQVEKECKRRGVEFVAITGRAGWQRFLKMRGFRYGC